MRRTRNSIMVNALQIFAFFFCFWLLRLRRPRALDWSHQYLRAGVYTSQNDI